MCGYVCCVRVPFLCVCCCIGLFVVVVDFVVISVFSRVCAMCMFDLLLFGIVLCSCFCTFCFCVLLACVCFGWYVNMCQCFASLCLLLLLCAVFACVRYVYVCLLLWGGRVLCSCVCMLLFMCVVCVCVCLLKDVCFLHY